MKHFTAVVASSFGLAMMEAFATGDDRMVFLDATGGTNRYGYQLYSLVVVDDFREGVPVAFMLTSSQDAHEVEVFMKVCSEMQIYHLVCQWCMLGLRSLCVPMVHAGSSESCGFSHLFSTPYSSVPIIVPDCGLLMEFDNTDYLLSSCAFRCPSSMLSMDREGTDVWQRCIASMTQMRSYEVIGVCAACGISL
jgi:hypothetical protein